MNNISSVSRKKTGTVTLGITLIIVGLTFMFADFSSGENMYILFSLWPVILIILGCEVLLSGKFSPESTFSFASVVMIFMLMVFSFLIAYMEIFYTSFVLHGCLPV